MADKEMQKTQPKRQRRNWIDQDLPMRKIVLLLAWPVMAQMFLQTLAQIVDMAMVGRLGKESIAAVGLSFRPVFVGHSIFLGLGTATTALVARAIGSKDDEGAAKAASQSLLTGAFLALLLACIAFFGAQLITVFMGAEGDVVSLGVSYLKGYSPGLFFMMMATLMTASLRGAGDTSTPFYAGVISNVVNVIANYILIFGKLGFPALGVLGAAIATSLSRVVSAGIMLYVLVKGTGGLHLEKTSFNNFDIEMIKRIFKIGIPAAIERFAQSFTLMLSTKIVASLGTTAIAIMTLSGNIEQLSFMPAIGFSVAASTLVGQNLGAKRPAQAEKSGWTAARLAMVLMGFMGALFIIIPEVFIRIYTNDPTVVEPARNVLRIVGIAQIPQALAFAVSGGLRGAGDTKSVLIVSIIGNVVLRLGLTYAFIFTLGWGLWSVYLAVIIDWGVRCLLLANRFHKGDWKQLEI